MSDSTLPEPQSSLAAQPSAAPAKSHPAGISFATALVLALVCSAASGLLSWKISTRSAQAPAVAVIDSERILKAQLEKVLSNPNMRPEDASATARQFTEGLGRELGRYTDAGIVVINSNVVVKTPAGLDVTQDVAQALGVHLK